MLKFLLITIVLFFVFGKLLKYAFKYWLLTQMQKSQNTFYQTGFKQKESRKEGDIKVEKSVERNSKGTFKKGGEYVDYEIVK